ncbi:hypothetical protein NQ315_012868 [Exocentrus adspersus]|uniref:Toxin-antitoxin system HicB family antitoxin n=1 Tax=Exocentrus adspersus TaxID=1586481 RepID=A0AAV8VGZ5_9CUCU|nr:hypothetical protein NQ315_012868 [Exocentrus adspersus]
MSFYLSEEVRQELKKASEDHLSINKVIEEALSEEVTIDTALQVVESLEQASLGNNLSLIRKPVKSRAASPTD